MENGTSGKIEKVRPEGGGGSFRSGKVLKGGTNSNPIHICTRRPVRKNELLAWGRTGRDGTLMVQVFPYHTLTSKKIKLIQVSRTLESYLNSVDGKRHLRKK